MNGINVAPTKSNYLRIKEDLALAREGYELLDHKREVLIHELIRLIYGLKNLENEINQKYQHFFELFRNAAIKLGQEKLELNLNFKIQKTDVEVIFRSIMGIHIPEIRREKELLKPSVSGLEDSCVELQLCLNMLDELYDILIRYIQTEVSVWKMVVEIKRTQRRVKSLENITIPLYEKTLKVIDNILGETEREDFFRMKRVKSKIKGSRGKLPFG